MSLFKRVLVANRGEIACRIIRTLKELGIESVAVYSEADRDSLHIRMADLAINIGGRAPKESYLAIDKIVAAIEASESDGVHPGYGFLSENYLFAKQVAEKTQATFIGPSIHSMSLMGDKISAKKLMKAHNIPTVPGCEDEIANLSSLENIAKEIGFPLILKAAAGGGGRGMRIVHESQSLSSAYESCRREAENYFGNPSIFCERYIANPRHIEFQVLFDSYGNGIHLYERDCSIQRRHQKLFEEAPSNYLTPSQREKLGAIAVKAASAANYTGAGTIEFICESSDKAYFMEMNTRIQVEHPVTEMITGIDLIAAQIKVASGQRLPWKQEDIRIHGWAMESRINAEDASQGFLPQVGVISNLHLPQGPFTRVDSHIYAGFEISDAYDSMIAKLITWGSDRNEARLRLLRALKEFVLGGLKTTCDFQEKLLLHPKFIESSFSTHFIAENEQELLTNKDMSDQLDCALVAASMAQMQKSIPQMVLTPKPTRWGHAALCESTRRQLL